MDLTIQNKFIEALVESVEEWVLITHDSCMDGVGSILACYKFAEVYNISDPTIVTVQYGKEFQITNDTSVLLNKNVLIADFSFNKETLDVFNKLANNLVVLDHHEKAKNDLEDLPYCHFDMSKSGAILTWEFLFPGYQPPILLEYIQDRDLWNWSLRDSEAVSNGLMLTPLTDYDTFYKLMGDAMECLSEPLLSRWNTLIASGNVVLSLTKKQTKSIASKQHKIVKWDTYNVPMLNTTTLLSEVGNLLSNDYPFVIMYFITSTEIVFSFRSSDPAINLNKLNIPRGHPHAAGRSISLDKIDLNKLFTTEDVYVYLMEVFNES